MNQMSNLGDGGNREQMHVSKWPWSGCFDFSCEGSAFLDDENVPCLEHCPETELGDHRGCENRRVSDITFSGSVRNDVGSSGILSCVRPTSDVTSRDFSGDLERDRLFPAIRKQSNKGYSSFEPSPPLEEIMDRSQPAMPSSNFTDSSEELKPLISKPLLVCSENNESDKVTNELDCVLKKEISYNKVLPFPVITKNLGSHEYSGAVNSLVEFDNHTNSHSVSLGCGQDRNSNGSNSSSSSTPTVTRDTMILCNDLDSACQVVPLSFSPNLYPDVGSVPLINCQLSVNKTVPPGTFSSLASTSCSSNSLVTLLNQTKNTLSLPASWPRRRPQSLRVAICYSDPEYLKDMQNASVISATQQEIGLNDMSARYHKLYPSSRTTNILASVTGSDNKSVQEKEDHCQVEAVMNIGKYNEGYYEKKSMEDIIGIEENLKIVKNRRLDGMRVADFLTGHGISHKDSNQFSDFSVLPEFSLDSTQISQKLLSPVMDAVPCHLGFDDSFLRSPGSDKENDPAMLSVRPKVQCSNTTHSPKKKKTSPKKKHRSPKKHRSASMKENQSGQQKSLPLMEQDEETLRSETSKLWSLNDDAWAVDDFLPVSSRSQSHSVARMLQDLRLSPAETPKVTVVSSSVIGASLSNKSQASKLVTTSSSSDEMDSSMITSTFSTDTGYETETTMNSICTDEYSTNDEKKLSRKITSPHSNGQKDSLSEICNPYSTPSNLATPDPLSEPSTPQTVADDTTEYFSICSELTNLTNASDDAHLPKNSGDDTPDFLSISSEMPGIPRLLEDSPLADLETQMLFTKDAHDVRSSEDCIKLPEALSNSGSCSLDSPASGEPSTLVESPAGQDSLSIPEAASGEQSPSDESSFSASNTPSQELVEIKYVQLSLSIVLAIVLHAMQSISQFMLEIFLASDQEDRWD